MRAGIMRFLMVGMLWSLFVAVAPARSEETKATDAVSVSFYEQVRPIFQARCLGCHQPAKASGEYVMTAFDRLLAGGESGEAAVVPGKPDASYLIGLITPAGGEAEMPKGKEPLTAEQIDLITRWIAQGAQDDTPASARVQFDADHPPTYSGPPVITSLDYSPDGNLLAVAGYYEVLLHKADGSELVARLVGGSERIESVKFSPDGKLLAATGGNPAESGELQIWDVETRSLRLSLPVTYDVLYGASWSPDGKLLAFGCSDKSVRAIEVATGKEILYQGAHEDRAIDTVFSADGSHVVSVSQDQSAKLTEVATQRFIDNITSITPGALTGGINAVDRHPSRDVILVGGADGEPKLYHIFRHTKRVIGDDANLIRRFPALPGRVFDVALSVDGQLAAACSSLDKSGQVRVFRFSFEMEPPADIQKISEKRVNQRTVAEAQKLAEYATRGVEQIAEFTTDQAGLYALAFRPDGGVLATAGIDGQVRLIDATTGSLLKQFIPVPLQPVEQTQGGRPSLAELTRPSLPVEPEAMPEGDRLVAIEVQPSSATLARPFDTVQLLVTGRLASGNRLDVTRLARIAPSNDAVAVSPRGLVTARHSGQSMLSIECGGQTVSAAIDVPATDADYRPDFVRDVAPVLSKLGCNVGTCHGANKGKAGFKLSLRGNDPLFDVRAYTDELACRRVNFAAPDRSLILAKASARVAHEGGRLTAPGETAYEIIRSWIRDGAQLDLAAPRVTNLAVEPRDPIVQQIGTRQQFRVIATYQDGSQRDVTAEAHLESGNTEVALVDAAGLASSVRRGEAPILARYEGAYAGTTLTVMGDRTGFVWNNPPAYNYIDELVYAKLQRTKTLPSDLCTDAEFLRRVSLDLVGLPPTAEEVQAFLDDPRESSVKRDELITRLIGSTDYIEHWTNKWSDLLQVNRKYLGVEGATAFRNWIRRQVSENRPYDEFAYEILTASGSNREHPAASYFKIHRNAQDTMETTTHLFLGLRFNCNKCHDHPFERWTQDQYYETAAFFAQFDLKQDPQSGNKKIGGTAVEGATPLYEIVYDKEEGEVKHDRTGAITPPEFPYPVVPAASPTDAAPATAEVSPGASPPTVSRRQQLAQWLTAAENRYFARSFVNRMWAYLLGTGLIEPIDDLRAGNPPTNPALLDRLTDDFIAHEFDVQYLVRTICQSRTYQLSIATNRWNEDDNINYSHAQVKRLPAEVLFDALHRATGSTPRVPGASPGARAATFLDPEVGTPDGFLAAFGRPPRESACECERATGVQFGPVMAMVSGVTVGDAISDPGNAIAKLVAEQTDDTEVIRRLFLRILNRPPTEPELATSRELFQMLPAEHEQLTAGLAKMETNLEPQMAAQEEARRKAVAAAQAALAEYEREIAPREAELERQHQERIAQREKELRESEATLPDRLAAWMARTDKQPTWTPLDPHDLSSTSATTLTRQDDLSVVSTNSNGLGTYKVIAHTDLAGITAVRLEALADDRSPKKGPGRSKDGNFVLTEFEVLAAAKGDAADPSKIPLLNPQADFSQKNYSVATAIDGRMDARNNGWAVAPKVGENHVALFELGEPVAFDGGTTLTFLLHQKFQSGEHTLGKFRLSVTTSPPPLLLDQLPERIANVLAIAEDQRNAEQKQTLLDYYRSLDPELKNYERALVASREPRAVDPKLQALRDRLAEEQRPVAVPPQLQQLRDDVVLSAKQLDAQRLTAAQDLAWALINSPAFLFNR